MSYILEALKKADQQRELGRVPGIDSAQEVLSQPRRRRWLWPLAGLLVLNAALLIVLMWPASENPAVSPLNSTGSPPLTMDGLQSAVSESPSPVVSPPPVPAPAPRVAVATPEPATAAVAPVPAKVVENSPAPPPGGEPEIVDAPVLQPPALPVWPQIPQSLFSQLSGGLRLDVHVYAEQPENRFVLINLNKYHEGEKLREGPLLEEITPAGVILSFRGERFRMLAQ